MSLNTRSFGRYNIIEKVGNGALSETAKAYDLQMRRVVALKMLNFKESWEKDEINQYLADVRPTIKLRHPNISTIYDVGERNNTPFFTTDFIEDFTSLKELVRQIPRPRAVEIMIKIGKAVHLANENNIIHGDIKPSNVIMYGDREPKMVGFALHKLVKEKLKIDVNYLDSLYYMAPEVLKGGSPSSTSDIYSMGILFYQLLTRELPFKGKNKEEIKNNILKGTAVPPSSLKTNIPDMLSIVCMTCIDKNAKKRYQTALEFVEDIERYKRGETIKAGKKSLFEKIFKKQKK